MGSRKLKPDHTVQWSKCFLVTFWVFQFLFMCILIAAIIFVAMSTFPAVYIFILIILCISIVLDVIEIVTYARHTLQPLTYLIFQVVKTVIWLAEFILALTNTIKVENDLAQITVDAPLHMLFNGLLEATVLLVLFTATLVYSGVIFHRHRRLHVPPLKSRSNPFYDRHYSGPYSENGLECADYAPLSPNWQPEDRTPHYFSEAGEIRSPPPLYDSRSPVSNRADFGRGVSMGGGRAVQEMDSEREAGELDAETEVRELDAKRAREELDWARDTRELGAEEAGRRLEARLAARAVGVHELSAVTPARSRARTPVKIVGRTPTRTPTRNSALAPK